MNKRGPISTKTNIPALIFTIVGLVSSIAVITLCAIFAPGNSLSITAIVFFAIIGLGAIILLFGETLDYAYIKDGYLIMRYIFKSGKIKVKDINYIYIDKNIYTIVNKSNDIVGTFNGAALGADKIITYLEQSHVPVKDK